MKIRIEFANKWGLGLLFPKADPFMMTLRYRFFREGTTVALIIGCLGCVFGDSSGLAPAFVSAFRWMTVGCTAIAILAVGVDMLGELRTRRLNLVSVFAIAVLLAYAGLILFFPW